jgi:50S ribosomal subunit-associated GTPase HflX
VDASDPPEELLRKLETSRDILFPEVDPSALVIVLNKRDLTSDLGKQRARAIENLPAREAISISARTGEGLKELREAISRTFQYPVEMRFRLPHGTEVESTLSWLRARAEVVEVKYDKAVEVHLFCQEKDHSRIVDRVVALGGQPA